MYYKFNEGTGNVIKSYTDLDDYVIPGSFDWNEGFRSDNWFD